MTPGMRFVVWDGTEYIAEMHYEDLGEGRLMPFFHLDVFYFSPEILKRMLKEWEEHRHTVPTPLFCMGEEDDEKFSRFISKFGFQYLTDCPCTDGKTRRLFVNFGPQEAQKQ